MFSHVPWMLFLLASSPFATTRDEPPAAVTQAGKSLIRIVPLRGDAYDPPPADEPGRWGRFPESARERQAREQSPHLDPAHPAFVPEAWANGAVIDARGLILVPFHVVEPARKVWVLLPDGTGRFANLLAADAASDWAVLELLDPPTGLSPIRLGNLQGMKQGERVWGLAWPEGQGEALGPCITHGTANRRSRPLPRDARGQPARSRLWAVANLVETEPSLGRNLSGALLVNGQGELWGLTSVMVSSGKNNELTRCLPLELRHQRLLNTLREGREVEYGFLGVDTEDVPAGEMRNFGVMDGGAVRLIREVTPGTPAAQARLQPGDILVSVQGDRVRDGNDLFRAVGLALAGSAVELEIIQQGQRQKVTVPELAKLGLPGPSYARHRPGLFRGLRVDYLSVLLPETPPDQPEARERLAMAFRQGGAVVREVKPGSAADRAGVRAGDIITHLAGQPVASPRTFRTLAENLKGNVEVTLLPAKEGGPARKLVIEEK
jgi:serine protease Do